MKLLNDFSENNIYSYKKDAYISMLFILLVSMGLWACYPIYQILYSW